MPVLALQALHPLRRRKLEEVSPLHQTQRLRAQSGVSHSHTLCQVTEKCRAVCISKNLRPCLPPRLDTQARQRPCAGRPG